MSFDHYERFFTFFAAGLGLFLAGGINFVLGQSGRRVWLRAIATLVICGTVVGGISALTRPELAIRSGSVLLGTLLIVTLLGSAWFGRQLTSLVALFRKPAVRWGVVALCGLGVVLGSGLAFDQADELAIDQGMKEFDIAVGHPPSHPTDRAHATTDRGNRIILKEPDAPREERDLHDAEEKSLRGSPYHDQVIRRGGPTDHSNCHGWVFTGGKFLVSPDDVELILKENGYHETHEPRTGDLVVYRQAGAVAHTAIVRYVAEGLPAFVEGKWGVMGVFQHPANQSFYGTDYTFYRSARVGHLLVGLGGSPGPADAPAVAE
jgi:hypothetical protein